MGYILIALGIIITLAGVLVLNKKSTEQSSCEDKDIKVVEEKVLQSDAQKEKTLTVPQEKTLAGSKKKTLTDNEEETPTVSQEKTLTDNSEKTQIDNKQKGLDFEKYVVSKFPKDYYAIKEWRGDKYDNGRYAESNQYPDLELALKYHDEEYTFAVECKWRSHFSKEEEISWCDDAQLTRYKIFAEQKAMPVFIVIGVGGEPSDPGQVYCVPLQQMTSSTVSQDFLKSFYHNPAKSFYYSFKKNSLD